MMAGMHSLFCCPLCACRHFFHVPDSMCCMMQEICETWKLRTPNEWEPIQWWSQLLSWRNQARRLPYQLGLPATRWIVAEIEVPYSRYPYSHVFVQVYNLTIRQFGALQSIAPNMHQMGYRCAILKGRVMLMLRAVACCQMTISRSTALPTSTAPPPLLCTMV